VHNIKGVSGKGKEKEDREERKDITLVLRGEGGGRG
jgi:hypothetical protein